MSIKITSEENFISLVRDCCSREAVSYVYAIYKIDKNSELWEEEIEKKDQFEKEQTSKNKDLKLMVVKVEGAKIQDYNDQCCMVRKAYDNLREIRKSLGGQI